MKHQGTIIIETERLILRPFRKEDAEMVFNNWANDERVTKFLTWQPHQNIDVTKMVINNWIDNYQAKDFYQWVIVLKETNEPIGSISGVKIDERIEAVEIGYCIGYSWWHKGYTSEALKALVKFYFEEVEAKRIWAIHDVNNPNSGKVMMKCGLKYEGTMKKAGYNNLGIINISMYGLIKEEYQNNEDDLSI